MTGITSIHGAYQGKSGFIDGVGNYVGSFTVVIDAAQFRGGGAVTIDKWVPAGSVLKQARWDSGGSNSARSINVGVVGDTDKFVDNQSMGTSSSEINLVRTGAALNITETEQLAVEISAANNAQRGALILEFAPLNQGLAVS